MSPRLVLFDIDETMIKSDGAGRRAITRALVSVFGITGDTDGVIMSGKTDPQICSEIMCNSGISADEINSKLPTVFALYPPLLKEEIERSPGYRLHDGIKELLKALSSQAAARLGLLTGNIEAGARLKLEPFALNDYFPIGAFGCDSADRMDLPKIARQRAANFYKTAFGNREVVIIGDSVNDVRCAAGFGAVSIAVNTGKTTYAELEQCRPDFLFDTLSDTSSVMAAILGG